MSRQPITQELIDALVITKPYYRTVRQMPGGGYIDNGFSAYIKDPKFAPGANQDVRSFLIIQEEFIDILEYIEPATANDNVYSLRLRNLLIRICTEVESHLKAILQANSYPGKPGSWTMIDYCKINQSHFVSDYKVYLPYWEGSKARQPFKAWSEGAPLTWYQDYNLTKHSRGTNLKSASLKNVVDAMAGLVTILSAQFYTVSFTVGTQYLELEDGETDIEHAIGGYFGVEFPDIPDSEKYSLDLSYTQNVTHEYQVYKYV